MSTENKSIHEFDYHFICEYFAALDRQGPGSPEMTLKALSFIDNLGEESRIIDLGCGTGGQTMVLAGSTPGKITGLDLFPAFIELFNQNAEKEGFGSRVTGIVGSMDQIPFDELSFDLIWSEGAIYNIGFERGLKEWHRYLKPGGFIAVSEASWFTDDRPEEIQKFWDDAYPEIDAIPVKVAQMQRAGYVPVATFILPDSCWTDHYHAPQVEAQLKFLQKYSGNQAAEELVASQRHEAKLFDQYKQYYGYVFYIGKKI